jgi:hypothetical protein
MSRHLTRIDADLFEQFRKQGHNSKEPVTIIVNRLLRYALPLAEAGVFNLPHDVIFTALERYGEQLLADAAAVATEHGQSV